MPSFMDRLRGAYNGFRDPQTVSELAGDGLARAYGLYPARLQRYALYWLAYQQELFKDHQLWPSRYQGSFATTRGVSRRYARSEGMYQYSRDLLGVFYQLGEFWPIHLQGGPLDPKAGDGDKVQSALPIVMEREQPAIRSGISTVWRWSDWGAKKDVATRWGAVLGDVFLEVCDDLGSQKVRVVPREPGTVKWIEEDQDGSIVAGELQYFRPDPRPEILRNFVTGAKPQVRYNERFEIDGDRVVYQTFLFGDPYPYPENVDDSGRPVAEWEVPYGFIPLVKVQHKDIGIGWGQSEGAPAFSGMRELADVASCLSDAALKAFNSPFLIAGLKAPRTPLSFRERDRDQDGDYGHGGGDDRDDANYLYGPTNARATSLVHPFDFANVGAHLDRLRDKLREDYPELSFLRTQLSGQASGESFREARKPAEAKVIARRSGYDEGSVKAIRMALVIAGVRGYDGFPWDEDSIERGDLDFSIGERPVFSKDVMDRYAEDTVFWSNAESAGRAGYPLEAYLADNGWTEERIAAFMDSKAKEADRQMQTIRRHQQAFGADPTQEDTIPAEDQ